MSGQQSYVLNDNDLKPYQSMFIRVTHLEKEYDKAREEITKLHEVIRSEWPEDQAEELIKQCKQ